MNFTQNERINQVTNETLAVGIDISSKRTKEFDDNYPGKNVRKGLKVIAKLVIDGRCLTSYILEDIYAELCIMNENRMRINSN